jgi:cell fate regulator YaaT (PSP1 superfamily)
MPNPIQVEFKAFRKEFFENKHHLNVKFGDHVVVQAENGVDLGKVSLLHEQIPGEQIGERELRNFVRLANPDEISRLIENRNEEEKAKGIIRQRISKFSLKMKLVDAEFQFDRRRLVIFFTADKRVDFRALVRDLAAEFKTRIELRQIGVRDEAKRVDGYGPCGKRLCCSSHLTEFKPISTDFAKDQGLQLNPSKLTGLCGRLKCCLAYERDFYVYTLSKFPGVGASIKTSKGPGEIKHLDIIGNQVHIKHSNDDEWETLRLEDVAKILGFDLDSSYHATGCVAGKCDTHDKVKDGQIENPLKDFMENDSFFDDHNFPRPKI